MVTQPIQINFSLIGDYMNAQINQRLVNTPFAATNTQTAAPSANATAEQASGAPPWKEDPTAEEALKQAIKVLSSGSLISSSDRRDALSAEEDSPKIFAAYEALQKLHSLASAIKNGDLSDSYIDRAEKRLNEGLEEISDFLGDVDLSAVTLLQGEKLSKSTSEVLIKRVSYDYTTSKLHEGTADEPVAAWAGLTGFDIELKRTNSTDTLTVDLTSLADNERTLTNVTDLINAQIEAVGGVTRFAPQQLGEADEYGVYEGDDWGMKISGSQTERLTFSTSASSPALYMVGASGATDRQTAQISKWTDLSAADPTRASTDLLAAQATIVNQAKDEDGLDETEHNDSKFIATATGPDGSVYALMETAGDIDGQQIRSETDLALVKYDSAGQRVWTRMIGNTDEISGTALAVSDDGRIAIGGTTNSELDASALGGEKDGFVMMFSSNGVQSNAYQQGTRFDDEVTSLAFDSTGALYIGGKTAGNIDGDGTSGGHDAYVEKLDAFGQRVWINQWGTADDDSITAITVDGDDNAIVAINSDGSSSVQRVSGETFTADDWSYGLGSSAVTALDWDNDDLYIGGETRYDGRTGQDFSGTYLDNPDAFAIKASINGTAITEDWFTRFGGDNAQTISDIIAHDGNVYISGSARDTFGSATIQEDHKYSVIGSLNGTDGSENWVSTLEGRGGISTGAGIAISANGSSDLDAFGLPNGALSVGDVDYVSDRTTARPGDHFYISVDGGRPEKIELEAGDTYRALTFKMNAELVFDGVAEARRGVNGQSLRITPTEGVKVELIPGENGQDLLSALGMPSGMLYDQGVSTGDSSSDAPPVVQLGLPDQVSLSSDMEEEELEDLVGVFDTAMRGLRKAYRYAIEDPTLLSLQDGGSKQKSTQASAYQMAQLANLQAGLDRLNAGSSSYAGLFI